MPTAYGDTGGIYSTWDDSDLDGNGTLADEWDFGSNAQYPALKLPQPAAGDCFSAPFNIDLTDDKVNCIYRPVAIPKFVSDLKLNEAYDMGPSNTDRITNVSIPRISGRLILVGVSAASTKVRIIFLPAPLTITKEEEISTTTGSNGEFSLTIALTEGLNRLAIQVRKSDTENVYLTLLETLEITLDSTSPTIDLDNGMGSAVTATATDIRDGMDTLHSLEYQRLSADDAEDCQAGFSGDALIDYTEPLPLTASDDLPAGTVYCFVATDQAGNVSVARSASVSSSTLRLRLRVFLESALP